MKDVFDYGEITEEHKAAAEEICDICRSMGYPEISELLKVKFKIVEKPTYDIDNSRLVKKCEEVGLQVNVQGYVEDGGMQYQLIAILDDIRNVEKLID